MIDGAFAGHLTTRAAQPGSAFFALDLVEAGHEVELTALGDGPVRVFGMTLDRSRAGVVVDALGINSRSVFTPLRWSEEHFVEQLRHQAPDSVVLAYGTNESIDPKLVLADVERGTVELLARVSRAAPDASCLLRAAGPGAPRLARAPRGGRRCPRCWTSSRCSVEWLARPGARSSTNSRRWGRAAWPPGRPSRRRARNPTGFT